MARGLLLWFVLCSAISAFSAETSVASKFKAPNADTSVEVAKKWKDSDEALWSYVSEKVPDVLEHTGSAAFDEHLRGVQAVLRYWNAPEHLASAGLFHSIYGTEGFQGFALPLSERPKIQDLIGKQAEKLCFIFCMVDRFTVDKTVMAWKPGSVDEDSKFVFRSRAELGRFELVLNKEEWLDFIELTLADWMEQVEGAAAKPSDIFLWRAGEAYAYRRLAYEKMSELLAFERKRLTEKAPELLKAVMATESPQTRKLIQMRTPPMSEAAIYAHSALRAAGEDIPEDLSPQPFNRSECQAS